MIIGLWHPGSGLGDQLFCYLAARITSERLGVEFGMAGDFKGKDFMHLDRGISVPYNYEVTFPAGRIDFDGRLPHYEGKTYYDPEFNFIEDKTIVDGCRLQDERYWEDYPIREWLHINYLDVPDDVCLVGFRGGEYATVPDLYLTPDYWQAAVAKMRSQGIEKFEVHTDSPEDAKVMLGTILPQETAYIHDIGINWRSMRYAKHAIIANSAFYIIPRLLSGGITLAPRYWARRNIKEWSTPQSYYKSFTYL